ncbi:hypothetical protein BK049_06480 [Bacillus xiamenensis]|uniref:Uncharacterized protein n=1 Tax=Bacillus xiamenensis TaxID=1178537 RepID=A0AAC9NC26_9BACI|nr:hypothetical protein BK049_06480 [Bacillus xiamenensis]
MGGIISSIHLISDQMTVFSEKMIDDKNECAYNKVTFQKVKSNSTVWNKRSGSSPNKRLKE